MDKTFYIQKNIGKTKYILNFHDGVKKHNDDSLFFDIEIFSNIKKLNNRIKELRKLGYKEG